VSVKRVEGMLAIFRARVLVTEEKTSTTEATEARSREVIFGNRQVAG